jgi:hypothetical protein
MTELGETLAQTPAARALFGDETRYEGFMRSVGYRWFVDPSARNVYPIEDHDMHSREFTADIRRVYAKYGARSRAGRSWTRCWRRARSSRCCGQRTRCAARTPARSVFSIRRSG